MDKTIVFTIGSRKYGITIKSRSLLADPEDQEIESVAIALLSDMRRLSEKYNNRGIAVLFEAD